MDLSGITTYAVWVNKQGNKIPQNDEERAQCKTFSFANDLCNWCNAKGHKATIYAKAPWNKDEASKNGVIVNRDTKVEGKA